MSAASTVVLVIPDDLINKNPKKWKRADVLAFLEANKEEFDLDDEDIDVIRKNKVIGFTFLKLTEEKLATSYKLPRGPASIIEDLIKELIHITSQEKDELQKEAPMTSPRLYMAKTSSMSAGNQTYKDLNPLLENELRGTIYCDVQGFQELFQNSSQQTDMHAVMAPDTFNEWLKHAKDLDNGKAFEQKGALWLRTFSQRISSSSDVHACNRFYYPTGNIYLRDAYHGALRKPDIILTRELDDVQASKPSWKDILVIGEFKANTNEDLSKDIILHVARYVREMFGAQSGRRFVHAFTVCGHFARFWFFDRVGVSISEQYDISSDSGQKMFMQGLLSYMKMTASQLGFDEHYQDKSGNAFLPNGAKHPPYLHLNGKRFKLLKVLNWRPAIITRGTLCWLATERTGCSCKFENICKTCKDGMCVVKEAWRDTKLTPESQLWQLAKKEKVFGCLDVLVACDVDVVSREGSVNLNNVRSCFDYVGAKPLLSIGVSDSTGKITGSKSGKSGPLISELATVHSEAEELEHSRAPKSATSKKTSKKRSSSEHLELNESPPSKKPKYANIVKARTRGFLVVRNVGESLESRDLEPLELVETLRDAIKCHRSLYEEAGILHCDISVYNIMRTTDSASGLKGFLIDLDYAQQHYPTDPNPNREQSTCITGTAPFMALELLLESHRRHTWRHDLESFFYVLIWLCTPNPYTTLDIWVRALSVPSNALAKLAEIISHTFFHKLLNGFDRKFEPLKGLAEKLWNVLFIETSANRTGFNYTTPHGDDARKNIYNKVIGAFDDCIADLQLKSQEEGDGQKEAEVNSGAEPSVANAQEINERVNIPAVGEESSDDEWDCVGEDTCGEEEDAE